MSIRNSNLITPSECTEKAKRVKIQEDASTRDEETEEPKRRVCVHCGCVPDADDDHSALWMPCDHVVCYTCVLRLWDSTRDNLHEMTCLLCNGPVATANLANVINFAERCRKSRPKRTLYDLCVDEMIERANEGNADDLVDFIMYRMNCMITCQDLMNADGPCDKALTYLSTLISRKLQSGELFLARIDCMECISVMYDVMRESDYLSRKYTAIVIIGELTENLFVASGISQETRIKYTPMLENVIRIITEIYVDVTSMNEPPSWGQQHNYRYYQTFEDAAFCAVAGCTMLSTQKNNFSLVLMLKARLDRALERTNHHSVTEFDAFVISNCVVVDDKHAAIACGLNTTVAAYIDQNKHRNIPTVKMFCKELANMVNCMFGEFKFHIMGAEKNFRADVKRWLSE